MLPFVQSNNGNGMIELSTSNKLFTARKSLLGQGNIFRRVCQEFSPRGCPVPGGGAWSQRGSWSQGVSSPRGYLVPGGCLVPGGLQAHNQGGSWGGSGPGPHPRAKLRGNWPAPPPPTASAVYGMHPTGMHSCFDNILLLIEVEYFQYSQV